MVQRVFTLTRDVNVQSGWVITDTNSGETLELPPCCVEQLTGKYMQGDEMLEKISTIQIALAGVTDSFRLVDAYSFNNRSVVKTFGLKPSGTIDDQIDFFLDNIHEYEKFHIIKMDRDIPGDDDSIHAYIETPKNGKVRSRFSRQDGIRLDAKRNKIDYWVADYNVVIGTNGGASIVPIGDPIEIM